MKKAIALVCIYLLAFAGADQLRAQTPESTTRRTKILQDYKMLTDIINRQKFPFPPAMGYRIKAALKYMDRLSISEFRPQSHQEYTLSLRNVVSVTLLPDTTRSNKEAVHFVLEMKDSVFVTSSFNEQTQYSKRAQVIFTLESPYLIAKAEALLNNICNDNARRKQWSKAKKLEETYCPPRIKE